MPFEKVYSVLSVLLCQNLFTHLLNFYSPVDNMLIHNMLTTPGCATGANYTYFGNECSYTRCISPTAKQFCFVNEAHFLSLSDDKMDLNHQLKAIQKIALIFKMCSPNEMLCPYT